MKKILLFLVFVLLISNVFAVGGGGGGGKPNCMANDWECTEWMSCNIAGYHGRTCALVNTNCKNSGDVKPLEFGGCEYISEKLSELKCHNLNTLEERVRCRLGLDEEQIADESSLLYLPEECRAMEDAHDQEECIDSYLRSQRCWEDFPDGDEREKCWKSVVGIADIETNIAVCLKEQNKDLCIHNLKSKVYKLIKLRLYNLEEKAEEALEEGSADFEDVVSFIVMIEKSKQTINKADNKEKKTEILLNVNTEWNKFRNRLGGGSNG